MKKKKSKAGNGKKERKKGREKAVHTEMMNDNMVKDGREDVEFMYHLIARFTRLSIPPAGPAMMGTERGRASHELRIPSSNGYSFSSFPDYRTWSTGKSPSLAPSSP